MKYPIYAFLSSVFFLMTAQSMAQKSSFTFSDTYPTNNVDSLEQWLKAHPQPTEERLKNLIRLKRTYFFLYPDRIDRDTLQIRQLSQRLNHPVGNLIRFSNFNELQQALTGFEAIKDTSGMIYVLSAMAASNYGNTALAKGDDYAAKAYLFRAKQLLKARYNVHDIILWTAYNILCMGDKPDNDYDAILRSITEALRLCENHPQCRYAWLLLKGDLAVIHFYRQDYAASYALNKEILAHLKPNQLLQIIQRTQNLANDCEFLGYFDERLALSQKTSKLIHSVSKYSRPYDYLNLYIAFREELARRGHYKEALSYSDSIVMIKNIIYTQERNQKLIEFEAENKQKQIAELTLEQIQTENRNRLMLILLAIALVVAAALSFLGLRLRRSNTRLNALVELRDEFIRIIAHDLRRPLHAFYGLSEVFSKLLQRGDQQAIVKLSRSIDQSGLYIRQMLDNLLYWALSQKGKLALTPTTFPLQSQLAALVSVYGAVTALKGISLEYDCPRDLTVHTDVNALDLILRNLIDNAIQQTPDQGNIRIEAKPVADSGRVFIRLSDTGKGMTQTQLQLVRDVLVTPKRFQPKQENLGLGLIIVSTFAQQAGILISVHSQEGKGATFEINLKTDK